MIVNIYETDNRSLKKSVCYDSNNDVLVFPEEILNSLNSTLTLTVSPLFKQYLDSMENLTDDTMIKLDDYLGTIGIEDTKIVNNGGRMYGVC